MLAGDFQRKLKKLNKNLHIYCGDDNNRPASLYWSKYNMGFENNPADHVEICGVDKNFIPEMPVADEFNHIVKGGWRRVLLMLVARNLVDKRAAEKEFRTGLDRAVLMPINREADPVLRAIAEAERLNLERNAGRAHQLMCAGHSAETALKVAKQTYDKDDMMDIGRMLHKIKKRG